MKRAPEIYALLVSELCKRDEEELESQQKSSEERIRISNLRFDCIVTSRKRQFLMLLKELTLNRRHNYE
jgi:hypothetical protein